MTTDRPLSPPPTPHWSESEQSMYPSPTSSSSNPRIKRRPSLKASYSSKSTSIRENVQVMVRCRPRSVKEMTHNEEACWSIQPEDGSIELACLNSLPTIRTFHFGNKPSSTPVHT
ncbi:uncharacterized protein EV154DRAFT_283571 [Mucor mucedo]|uniref:uncharacterized protein n=1 Tax=Mucor mucedo TaxID=29922 RepID=UPI00221FC2A9|nr:uncharacterized protein EV154DRAFT_283571 [Mucor mucedo]KAI7889468.1 hypothetical protein EV154DRAFT_283571 [Mucor mucedo]